MATEAPDRIPDLRFEASDHEAFIAGQRFEVVGMQGLHELPADFVPTPHLPRPNTALDTDHWTVAVDEVQSPPVSPVSHDGSGSDLGGFTGHVFNQNGESSIAIASQSFLETGYALPMHGIPGQGEVVMHNGHGVSQTWDHPLDTMPPLTHPIDAVSQTRSEIVHELADNSEAGFEALQLHSNHRDSWIQSYISTFASPALFLRRSLEALQRVIREDQMMAEDSVSLLFLAVIMLHIPRGYCVLERERDLSVEVPPWRNLDVARDVCVRYADREFAHSKT
jgi:hypothetical protein